MPDLKTQLATAIGEGNVALVKSLITKGANVEMNLRQGSGAPMTPLMVAAELDKPEILQALIDAGANVNNITSQGGTALLSAAANAGRGSLEVLVNAGANLDGADNALYTAIRKGRCDSALYLIEQGADCTKTHSYHGDSPEELARKQLEKGDTQFQEIVDKIDERRPSLG